MTCDANLLADLDPFVAHNQITDYTHPLDPWGNSMLGVDSGGQQCFWGNTALQNNDAISRTCGRVYGYGGPELILDDQGVPGFSVPDRAINFQACRYLTHDPDVGVRDLSQPGVVLADGTTDGGCHAVPAAACGRGSLVSEVSALRSRL